MLKQTPNLLPLAHAIQFAWMAAAVVTAAAMAASGQTAQPQFEVASIKPGGGRGAASVQQLPGRLTANAPLRGLVQAAYNVQPFQVVGGAEWTGSEPYEVDAKAAGNPDRGQMLLMLQSLLAERFHLRIHREPRDMPVYALVAARGGLKLPPPQNGSCVEGAEELLGALAIPGARVQPAGQGARSASKCGEVEVALGAGALIRGDHVPMGELVRVLSRVLGRTVIDRTGFSGAFDVKLNFQPDDATPGLPPPPPGANSAAGLSLFSAIQQLGLRLESAKGPAEVLVIDQVERPSPN